MEPKTKKRLLIVGIVAAVVIIAAVIGVVAVSNASHILHLDANKVADDYNYNVGFMKEDRYTYYYDDFTLSENVWKMSDGLTVWYTITFPTGIHPISWWDNFDNWQGMINDVWSYHNSKYPRSAEVGYMVFTETYNGETVGFEYVPEDDSLRLMSKLKVDPITKEYVQSWKPKFWSK